MKPLPVWLCALIAPYIWTCSALYLLWDFVDRECVVDDDILKLPFEEWPALYRAWSHLGTFLFKQSLIGFGGKRVR